MSWQQSAGVRPDRTPPRLMCRFAKIAVQRMMEVLLRLTLQYQRLALCILQAIFEVSRLAGWRSSTMAGA